MGLRGELFSTRFNTEKRTYFFNVKENRNGDLFLNIVESKKHGDIGGYERQSVIVFDEELEQFTRELNRAIDFMKKKS
jgi:hypothetical protein